MKREYGYFRDIFSLGETGEDLEVSTTGGTSGPKDQVRVTRSASSEIISLSVAVAVTGNLVGSSSGFISI